MAPEPPAYLLVLGEREGIWWVLSQRRMAFESHRAALARRLEPGTRLLLYATRGAFHNATRDRGQVIGEATVASAVGVLEPPVVIAGREFRTGCDLDIRTVAPRRRGVDLAPLIPGLQAFPAKHAWRARLRQPLVALPEPDVALLRDRLEAVAPARPTAEATQTYRWRRVSAA
jgi:hypothetical protein